MDSVLEKPRHERFAQAVTSGLSVERAYVEAGYSFNSGNAHRLNGNERVRQRVEELQARTADGLNYDRQWFLEEQLRLYRQCRDTGALAAANTALKQAAVLAGHWSAPKHEEAGEELSRIVGWQVVAANRDGADLPAGSGDAQLIPMPGTSRR